jgi:hypothetical protein
MTAWASGQEADDGINQPLAHGRDRVWNVPFRPQRRILWVCNRRVR